MGKDDNNLLTCDVVCHGVPSPKVFAAYQAALEHRHGASVKRIAFRRKDYGWKRFSVALSFDNATEYRQDLIEDPFMIGFFKIPTCGRRVIPATFRVCREWRIFPLQIFGVWETIIPNGTTTGGHR